MRKRILAVSMLVILLFAMCSFPVSASSWLENVPQPYNLMYSLCNEEEEDTLAAVYFSVPDEIAALYNMQHEDLQALFGEDVWWASAVLQIDLSLDSKDAWQYTPEWDTDYTLASNYVWLDADTSEYGDIFWLAYDVNIPVLEDIVIEENTGGEICRKLDLNNHKLYVRTRFFIEVLSFEEKKIYLSNWTEATELTEGTSCLTEPNTLDCPIVSNLHLGEDGDNLCYVFDMQIPESVKYAETWLNANDLGYVEVQIQVNQDGTSWEDCELINSYTAVSNGQKSFFAADMSKGAHMRVRYNTYYYDDDKVLQSPWSDVLSFGSVEAITTETNNENAVDAMLENTDNTEPSVSKETNVIMNLMLILLGVLVVILIAIVIVFVAAGKKKRCPCCAQPCKKTENVCVNCGYSFDEDRQESSERLSAKQLFIQHEDSEELTDSDAQVSPDSVLEEEPIVSTEQTPTLQVQEEIAMQTDSLQTQEDGPQKQEIEEERQELDSNLASEQAPSETDTPTQDVSTENE